jgi:hypothetical protein
MKSRYQFEAALGYAPRQSLPRAGFGAWLRNAFSLRLRLPKSEPQPREGMRVNEHLAQDMGLTRSHADRPVVRPYWRA